MTAAVKDSGGQLGGEDEQRRSGKGGGDPVVTGGVEEFVQTGKWT
jgi:hypothetical protein